MSSRINDLVGPRVGAVILCGIACAGALLALGGTMERGPAVSAAVDTLIDPSFESDILVGGFDESVLAVSESGCLILEPLSPGGPAVLAGWPAGTRVSEDGDQIVVAMPGGVEVREGEAFAHGAEAHAHPGDVELPGGCKEHKDLVTTVVSPDGLFMLRTPAGEGS